MENIADVAQTGTISNQDMIKACTNATCALTLKEVKAVLAEFGTGIVYDLDQEQRREFIDAINEKIETGGHHVIKNRIDHLAKLPESVRTLMKKYEALDWGEKSGLEGGSKYLFVRMGHDLEVTPPADIPHIVPATGDAIYFMIPKEIDLPFGLAQQTLPELASELVRDGVAHFPEEDEWPNDDTILKVLGAHSSAVFGVQSIREAKELLELERRPSASLYASSAQINETTPMLIEGLIPKHGVSTFYGAFDEFKTTLVLDMMAHVAIGVPWQGLEVMPHPVIWYALEGIDEIPIRLRAHETNLKGKDSAWGDDRAPVTVLDRIPKDYRDWRAEIIGYSDRWKKIYDELQTLGELPAKILERGEGENFECVRYPFGDPPLPVVVIDTLSIALGGEDEKGPKAVGLITDCLDLLKERPDMAAPANQEDLEKWEEQHLGKPLIMDIPAASHVFIIHHQTKTGIDFAGHRAIGADTSGLYRIHRFGNMTDVDRPYSGLLTPQRVKGIPRPAPIRFDVNVVPVEGTKQTAAILKNKVKAIPKKLKPIIEALRKLNDHEEIYEGDVKACLDEKAANRTTRNRYRKELEAAGVLEPVVHENGKVASYRFHDTGAF